MPTRGKRRPPPRPRRKSAAERGYDGRWRRARAEYLAQHPLCVACERAGLVTAATVVDHVRRHRGQADPRFWDRGNWQPLCKRCHDQKTAAEGRSTGY